MNNIRLILGLSMLLAFGILGFSLYFSIKKHEANKAKNKKSKGRSRYMPEVKKFGR